MTGNTQLFLQLALIVGVSRACAWLFRRMGQTQVVGEMAAGIALGPTLFGQLFPEAHRSFFPPGSLGPLQAFSQVGIAIFVFLVGVRTDFEELRPHSRLAAVTSVVSIAAPLAMGALLAFYLLPRYGSNNPTAFCLFLGVAISVTAFPVLARILMERNLLETRIGALAIACAAVSDLAAWALLAVLTVLTQGSHSGFPLAWLAPALVIYGICAMGLRRLLPRIAVSKRDGELAMGSIAVLLVVAMISAAATEWMGLHALVGAFVAGLITPRSLRKELIEHLEPATLLLMIPIFFALTGLKTNLVVGIGVPAYLDLGLILFVAVVSKWGAAAATSRWMGLPWNEASQLGLMLNARGLVELVVLNVGLELGIIPNSLFSLMVCMAIVTTIMATPLIDWLRRRATGD